MNTNSLLTSAEVAALRVPGTVPDPETARHYLDGRSVTHFHAIPHACTIEDARKTVWIAACGDQVSKGRYLGTYDRTAHPEPGRSACLKCAWIFAVHTASIEREIRYLTPSGEAAHALAAWGTDGFLNMRLARAVLGAHAITPGDSEPNPAAIELLTVISEHTPYATYNAACLDSECDEHPAGCEVVTVACRRCTLTTGEWAGPDFADLIMPECEVKFPCSVIQAMTSYYKITSAVSPYSSLQGTQQCIDVSSILA